MLEGRPLVKMSANCEVVDTTLIAPRDDTFPDEVKINLNVFGALVLYRVR
jgi:hypothetical protein